MKQLFWILLFAINISCSGGHRANKELFFNKTSAVESNLTIENSAQNMVGTKGVQVLQIVSPTANAPTALNSPIDITIAINNQSPLPDSIVFYYNNSRFSSVVQSAYSNNNETIQHTIPALLNVTTGRNSININSYINGQIAGRAKCDVIVYSDIVPTIKKVNIVNSYTHDRNAFTQGLVVENGRMYEGTGNYGNSSLREIEISSGKIIRQHNLSNRYFGEGITIIGNKIYQLTWQNREGFIYNKDNFEQIGNFRYSSEGWGLTTIGNNLVMSDGSNILYFLDSESFAILRQIEVYDNNKAIDQLNELEYINGEIWANIWYSDLIARIDPASGKVLGFLDLSDIATKYKIDTRNNVLNGIAFDSIQNKIYITGKNWNKLFEIAL